MTREEMLNLLTETWSNDEGRTDNAIKLNDEVNHLYDLLDDDKSSIENLNNKIDDLRRVNMDLYARVTTHETHDEDDDKPKTKSLKEVVDMY